MLFIFEIMPLQLSFFRPFAVLSEILSHKQKLLTWMTEHKSISGLQVLEFIIQLSWHLLQHRTLQMYYLIMRQNQNIFLTVCISHRKCHLIMIKFTEIWI